MSNEKMSDLYKTENEKEIQKQETLMEETKFTRKIILNPKIYKRHKRYLNIFFILSILSILDIGSRQKVAEQFGLSDAGYISFFIGAIFGIISPAISAVVTVALSLIFSFAVIWIPIAIIEYFHVKKLEKVKNNKNNFIQL